MDYNMTVYYHLYLRISNLVPPALLRPWCFVLYGDSVYVR